jgi:hypothetical protein
MRSATPRSRCCSPTCTEPAPSMPHAGVEQQCDDGNGSNADACVDGCLAATCGDGFTRAGVEQCDEGAGNSDSAPDACRTSCLAAFCGDGVRDSGEACDDGDGNNEDNCPDGAGGTCQPARCGDGFVDRDPAGGTEECERDADCPAGGTCGAPGSGTECECN